MIEAALEIPVLPKCSNRRGDFEDGRDSKRQSRNALFRVHANGMTRPVKAAGIFCKAGVGVNSKNATVTRRSNGSGQSVTERSANLAQVLFRSRGRSRSPIFLGVRFSIRATSTGLRRLFAQIDAVCKKRRALYLMIEAESALPFLRELQERRIRARFRTLPAVAHRQNPAACRMKRCFAARCAKRRATVCDSRNGAASK